MPWGATSRRAPRSRAPTAPPSRTAPDRSWSGDREARRARARAASAARASRIEVVHAEEAVGMDEPPITRCARSAAPRSRLCAELVRDGRAAGDGHRRQHRRRDGRRQDGDRRHRRASTGRRSPPSSPTPRGRTVVLDVGANVDSQARAPAPVRGDGALLRPGGDRHRPRRASACCRSARRRPRAPTSPARSSGSLKAHRPQLRRQRRGPRRLQRQRRRRGLRRLRRQRRC